MLANSQQEDVKLAAMQRAWQPNRRLASTLSLFEKEPVVLEEFISIPRQNACNSSISPRGPCLSTPSAPVFTCSDIEADLEIWEIPQEKPRKQQLKEIQPKNHLKLDASELGDFPAQYTITSLESHQFPAIGVYIDKRVVPGFKYRVRPLPALGKSSTMLPCLFNGKGLTLKTIGRGYARRFIFEADKNKLNDNENYFWSDNHSEGCAFELEVISDGDKFTLYDANREAQGIAEVLKIEGPQIEVGGKASKEGVEKRVKVKFIGKVEFFETGVAKPMPLSGVAICIKKKGSPHAEITRIINININHHRYYFTPGFENNQRRVTVRGQDIGDVPTKYTMTGLEPYEIPVVGTYVDPRIIPGFYYRVRPNDRKRHLFNGRALRLCSIGMGYAKRLTFEPDSAIHPNNYLWSDSHPDGLGLEPRAVHKGMQFSVIADGKKLGEATVFRTDLPQNEEKMEREMTTSGKIAIVKYIHINVMCHIRLSKYGGGSTENEEHLMGVYGLAVVRKEPHSNHSKVIRVENVGLDSQLNLLFAQTHTELTFVPI